MKMEENKNQERARNEKIYLARHCFISRETIRQIIELSAHEQEEGGDVWGDDMVVGTMNKLIDDAIEIIKRNLNETKKSNRS